MADYAPSWGIRSETGSYQFSDVIEMYTSPDIKYLKCLIAFNCDKVRNIANLSRIDPTLLGIKDLGTYMKNLLYLHSQASEPLLCFSIVLVMNDSLEDGRTFGSDPKSLWVVKQIDGVLAAVELEHLVAVLGLAFRLPYVPDDSARIETDLLHFSMAGNTFGFTTVMAGKSEVDGKKMKFTSNVNVPKHSIFALVSPALSKNVPSSFGARKPSLHASEMIPVYYGRKHQLKVPDELHKIPKVLKHYLTKIPQYSLVLIAYTVSSYTPPSGAHQDQLTANLNIQFAVVLHEPATASGSKMKTGKDEKVESEAAGSETAESETAESEAAGSEAADSDAAESDAAESEAAESEEAESD